VNEPDIGPGIARLWRAYLYRRSQRRAGGGGHRKPRTLAQIVRSGSAREWALVRCPDCTWHRGRVWPCTRHQAGTQGGTP
jgi:hypothetical protein